MQEVCYILRGWELYARDMLMARVTLLLLTFFVSGCGDDSNSSSKFQEIRGAITSLNPSCPRDDWHRYSVVDCTYKVRLENRSPIDREIEPIVTLTTYDCDGNTLDSSSILFDRISSGRYQQKSGFVRYSSDGTLIRIRATADVFDVSNGRRLGRTTLQGVDGEEFGHCF